MPIPTRTRPVQAEVTGSGPAGLKPHASPSVRKFARELGVDLARVTGTGPKGRIVLADVQAFVKGALARGAAAPAAPAVGGLAVLPWPQVDFAKFGPIETQALSRIKKISGANLHRNWVMIPHVTNNDVADITDLEALRVQLNKENEKSGVKLTMLAFLIKASVAALKKHPEFNSSLDGDNLVLKRYYHIGFAADTPNGLMVPVIKDADRKGIMEVAGNGRARQAGARGQAQARRHAGRHVLHLESRRHRRHVVHADHQCAGGRDPRRVALVAATGVGREELRAAAHAAALALL
jgi:pyruvate dehydrogenase E2 component (dihydrolipoamide acetyltransferase)